MSAYYNLFLRNWMNHRATIAQIDDAVVKQYLTPAEGETIKGTAR